MSLKFIELFAEIVWPIYSYNQLRG